MQWIWDSTFQICPMTAAQLLSLPQFLHSPSIYSHFFSWVVQFDSQHYVKAHHEGALRDLLPRLVSQNQALQAAFPQPPQRPVPLSYRSGFFLMKSWSQGHPDSIFRAAVGS